MVRTVLLPRELDERLSRFTKLIEEVDGVLLYRRQDGNCPIEALFITGVGSFGCVRANSGRTSIANEFFRRNPDYQFAKFYVYSNEAVKKFEEDFVRYFSKGNVGVAQDGLEYKASMSMLVTPTMKVLDGADAKLLVVSNFQCYRERNKMVEKSLVDIGRELGYR